LRKHGLIRYRYDDARPNDYLNGWIEHLFLNAMERPEAAPRTTWHSRDGHYILPYVEDARRSSPLLGSTARGCIAPSFLSEMRVAYVSKAGTPRPHRVAQLECLTPEDPTPPTALRCAVWTTR
jgi:hypothetical protein